LPDIQATLARWRARAGFDVFVDPASRGGETERAMLLDAYRVTRGFMAGCGKANTWVVSDVYACDEPRARLLTELGFAHYRTWDHVTERSLAEPPPAAPLPDGYTLRGATFDDADRLAAVRNESFGDTW